MTTFEKITACYPHLTLNGVLSTLGVSIWSIIAWCQVNQKAFDVKEVSKTPKVYWEVLEKYLIE